ncbi:unnamed protein product, partial [Tetraodon nigroviridis]
DPVPAFKSWQDDSEGGEAQLSPLAGRMVPLPPLPLEEEGEEDEKDGGQEASPSSSRAHPHLLARRFLDFGAHSAQRFLQQDLDATSPTKAQRPRRASFGSKEAMKGADSVTHQLTKKLQHLKKKIKQFEEQFEKERNYKPSHGDKAANPKVLKWMTDLTKIRRQIKDAKHRAESELGPQTRPRSNTLPKSFGSTLEQSAPDPAETKGPRPTREETLELIQRRVKGKRQEDGWPDDIKKMTKEQLSCEKTVLQKNLLHYEGLHGRPVSRRRPRRSPPPSASFVHGSGVFQATREERLVVKPLYERYRLVKQMLTRVSIAPVTVSPSLGGVFMSTHTHAHTHTHARSHVPSVSPRCLPPASGEVRPFSPSSRAKPLISGRRSKRRRRMKREREGKEEGKTRGGRRRGMRRRRRRGSEVIMAVDLVTQTDGPMRSQNQADGQGDCPMTAKLEEGSGRLALDLRLSSSNASSMPELLEQLWRARAEKKKLRKTIREFEEDFYQHNGRSGTVGWTGDFRGGFSNFSLLSGMCRRRTGSRCWRSTRSTRGSKPSSASWRFSSASRIPPSPSEGAPRSSSTRSSPPRHQELPSPVT